jgi:hypothetical protein
VLIDHCRRPSSTGGEDATVDLDVVRRHTFSVESLLERVTAAWAAQAIVSTAVTASSMLSTMYRRGLPNESLNDQQPWSARLYDDAGIPRSW